MGCAIHPQWVHDAADCPLCSAQRVRERARPRPAYHRRSDLTRLKEHALSTPLIVSDNGERYEVRVVSGGAVLRSGRYEVVHAYIAGFKDACDLKGELR